MKYGILGRFIKFAFAQTAFDHIAKEIPEMDMPSYKKRVFAEYKAIVARTPGICKLTRQERCEEITKYLCRMDYYTFEMQGAVLDRTKTLGYGDDECNFHLMSQARAREIGFVKSPGAK